MQYRITPKQIGARIREAREGLGLSQEQLAEVLGHKYASDVSKYENGHHKLSVVEIVEFARALEKPITFFFQDALTTETDMETLLLDWFRSLPDPESKKRVFLYLEQMRPLIIGEDKTATYRPKSKRKG